ncbi:hypothetical protein L248_3155 [Schleiferilactobacillus shenzhenensis LY-73]|uniref:Uncharacterized protein n=1 Tax=Schleiferilactobacillus shenzhenensis LY-73 TaxID=1231336 RepID=U4TSY4_9LACO|nr:hypothetical protein L248_3155 [Schleiferilactobacillus shenzhenensis LY-73]
MGKFLKLLFVVIVMMLALPLIGVAAAAAVLIGLGGAGLAIMLTVVLFVPFLIIIPLVVLISILWVSRRREGTVKIRIRDDAGTAEYAVQMTIDLGHWLKRGWHEYRAQKRAGRGETMETVAEELMMTEVKPEIAAAVAKQYSAADGARVLALTSTDQIDIDFKGGHFRHHD